MSKSEPLNPLNLNSGTYFIRTSDKQNPYLSIRGLDDIVSRGVYSFLINGSSYLLQGSEIQFELIDANGNQVSIGGVRNILKGTSRVVSFEITDDVPNGEITLYVSATLSTFLDQGEEDDVPQESSNAENFLFVYRFQVDKTRVNTDEIIFRKPPVLTVTPTIKTVRDLTKTTTTTSTISADVDVYDYNDGASVYTIRVQTSASTFVFDMNGGSVNISNSLDLTLNGIISVIDDSTANIEVRNPDIEIYDEDEFKGILSSPISFTITYNTIPDIGEERLQEKAIADIQITDMGVVSGDVAKIRIYGKSDALNTNYTLLSETDVDNKNLLELEATGSIGIFNTSNKVGAWSITKEDSSVSDPSIASNSDVFLSGLVINGAYDSPSYKAIGDKQLQTPRYVLESNANISLNKNVEYILKLNTSVTNVPANDTRLDVYFKSSAITTDNKFGKLIHSFRTNSDKIWRDLFDIVFSVDANTTDGELVFVTTSGRWYLQDIRLFANIQDGFSPQEFRTEIPVEIVKPNQDIDFKVEFFDGNNNKASLTLLKDNVIFERPNIVVEGSKNVTPGEMYLGTTSGSGILVGGSGDGGVVQSFGYTGFNDATGSGASGFLIFSGSVLTGSSTSYQGVGLELVADSDNFLKFRTDPSEFIVNTQTFFFGNPSSQFISGSNGNIEISSSLFHLDPTNNIMIVSGTIQASDGNIGNFQIIDGKISGSNITMDAITSTIFKTDQGPGSDPQSPGFEYLADEYYIDFTPTEESPDNFYIKMGPNFMVDKDGILIASGATFVGTITASAGLLGGFVIGSSSLFSTTNNIFISGSPQTGGVDSSEYMFISTSNFNVKENGDITGSQVLFTGGKIGGFTITNNTLQSDNFFLSGSATGDDFFISASNMNIKADGQITGSEVLFTGGTVGGFTITDTLITASNLEINSDGTIQTPNFADGVRGFQITALGNGSAQFENIKIRGTLRTTVFEKETVNAVGGQLWVANSTILSQSITAVETTMSVENVSGFEVGEILLIKNVDDTGFNSEYVLIESSSRTFPASSTNFTGKLFVDRAYAAGLPTGSDVTWVSELASSAEDYTEGQVIVSTGKQDTGWILLNASPNNTYTPYIDIVERTGSGVYDYELKARLGDLSGLSTTQLLGNNPATAGFGLFSENVFLQGGITATYGSIGGFGITQTAISSSNDKLILRSNGQITGSSFLFGDVNAVSNYIQADGGNVTVSGTINVIAGNAATQDFVNTATSSLSSSASTALTGVSSSAASDLTNTSSSLASDITNASSSLSGDLTTFSSSTADRIVTDAANKIVKPNDAPAGGSGLYLASKYLGYYSASDGWNAYISSSGEFLFKADDNNLVSFASDGFVLKTETATISGSFVNIVTPTFFFGTDTPGSVNYISGSNNNLEISSSNFVLAQNGDATFGGTLSTPSGDIGGFTIGDNVLSNGTTFAISGSATGNEFFISASTFNVKANGDVTGSSVLFDGGKIGGFSISDTQINNSSGTDLILKSDGQITASAAQIKGSSEIAGFTVTDTQIKDSGENIIMNSDGTFQAKQAILSGSLFSSDLKLIVNNELYLLTASIVDNTALELRSDGTDFYFQLNDANVILSNTNLELPYLSTQATETTVLTINGANNVVGKRDLGSNAFTSTITVGTGLDITNATTAPTISLDLTEVTANSGTSNAVLTNDGDGTVTAETNLTYAGTDLTNAGGAYVVDRATTNFAVFRALDTNDNGVQMGIDDNGQFYISPYRTGSADFDDELRVIAGLGWKIDQALGVGVNPNATNGRIDASNDIVGFSTSDERLKENILKLTGSLDRIEKIDGVSFDWKEFDGKLEIHANEGKDVGLIAQQVEEILPESVQTRDNGYKAVRYEKLIPLLVEGIKELSEENKSLKQQLKELKDKVDELL